MINRILVADDSEAVQKAIKLAFAAYRIDIYETNSFVDTVAAIRKVLPQLLIIDASLTGTDGPENFKLISNQFNIKMILLEGSFEPIDRQAFYALGFKHILKKPFNPEHLLSMITRQMGGKLSIGEPAYGQDTNFATGPSSQAAPGSIKSPPPPPSTQIPMTQGIGSNLGHPQTNNLREPQATSREPQHSRHNASEPWSQYSQVPTRLPKTHSAPPPSRSDEQNLIQNNPAQPQGSRPPQTAAQQNQFNQSSTQKAEDHSHIQQPINIRNHQFQNPSPSMQHQSAGSYNHQAAHQSPTNPQGQAQGSGPHSRDHAPQAMTMNQNFQDSSTAAMQFQPPQQQLAQPLDNEPLSVQTEPSHIQALDSRTKIQIQQDSNIRNTIDGGNEKQQSSPIEQYPSTKQGITKDEVETLLESKLAESLKNEKLISLFKPLIEEIISNKLEEALKKHCADLVSSFCSKNFQGLAEKIILEELRQLAEERSKHSVDS